MSNIKSITQKTDEAYLHVWDVTDVEATTSSTISTIVWTLVSGTTVTISNEVNADPLVKALITSGSTPGRNCVTTTVTYADGQIQVLELNITVVDSCG